MIRMNIIIIIYLFFILIIYNYDFMYLNQIYTQFYFFNNKTNMYSKIENKHIFNFFRKLNMNDHLKFNFHHFIIQSDSNNVYNKLNSWSQNDIIS